MQVYVDYLRSIGHPDVEKRADYLEKVKAKAKGGVTESDAGDMKTTVAIDNELISEAMKVCGLKAVEDVIAESLNLLICIKKQNTQGGFQQDDGKQKQSESEKFRKEAADYADNHPAFVLNWENNKLSREEMNER